MAREQSGNKHEVRRAGVRGRSRAARDAAGALEHAVPPGWRAGGAAGRTCDVCDASERVRLRRPPRGTASLFQYGAIPHRARRSRNTGGFTRLWRRPPEFGSVPTGSRVGLRGYSTARTVTARTLLARRAARAAAPPEEACLAGPRPPTLSNDPGDHSRPSEWAGGEGNVRAAARDVDKFRADSSTSARTPQSGGKLQVCLGSGPIDLRRAV